MDQQMLHTHEEVTTQLWHLVGNYTTQAAAAKALGISNTYLNDMLHGKRDPSEKMLRVLGYRRIVGYVKDDA